MLINILLLAVGFLILIKGADWFVDGASNLAKKYNVSDLAIGLTIVAAGTSLPELATSVIAAIKKNNDIAVGNIIGSNIFNIFFILGTSSLIKPVVYSSKFNPDLYLLSLVTIALFIAMFSGVRKKLDRWEAGVMPVSCQP
jgi:cation:H+ antiporter